MPTLARLAAPAMAGAVAALGLAAGGAAAAPALPSRGPLSLVYDTAGIAQVLYQGADGAPGLSTTPRSARQTPTGDPFPVERQIGKVSESEIVGRGPGAIAGLIAARLAPGGYGLVAIDEVGADLQDDRSGPALLGAMRILAGRRHEPSGEPMSRRVLMYLAPKMVANVGSGHDRELWDDALAAAGLSGGAYLEMYHADGGRITGPATEAEWRDDLPVWRSLWPGRPQALRVILTAGHGVGQDAQWRWAAATPAGRSVLRDGVGEYRLGGRAEALAWLRNWRRWALGGAEAGPPARRRT